MKLSTLKEIIGRVRDNKLEELNVVIPIKLPYSTMGRIPTVNVESVQCGIDWESGLFIIKPEESLTPSDRDFAQQMRDMQERAGNYLNENRRLKEEIRILKKQLGK